MSAYIPFADKAQEIIKETKANQETNDHVQTCEQHFRNFYDFSKPPPATPGDDELAVLPVPFQWSPSLLNKLHL